MSCCNPTKISPHNLRRQLFTACRSEKTRGSWLSLRRFLTTEAKTSVRAVPVEGTATRSRWTGTEECDLLWRSFLKKYFPGDQIGRAIVGGGCIFGIGSLCFYGLGLSDEMGAIDKARCVGVGVSFPASVDMFRA